MSEWSWEQAPVGCLGVWMFSGLGVWAFKCPRGQTPMCCPRIFTNSHESNSYARPSRSPGLSASSRLSSMGMERRLPTTPAPSSSAVRASATTPARRRALPSSGITSGAAERSSECRARHMTVCRRATPSSGSGRATALRARLSPCGSRMMAARFAIRTWAG